MCANLPYNVTTPLLTAFLEAECFESVTVMVQKEVAERIAEKPGTKTYGILSVMLQAWYDIEYLFSVGPAVVSVAYLHLKAPGWIGIFLGYKQKCYEKPAEVRVCGISRFFAFFVHYRYFKERKVTGIAKNAIIVV